MSSPGFTQDHINQHLVQRHDDCLPVIRKVNPHEEGDSEGGEKRQYKYKNGKNTKYDTNAISSKGKETHKTMLEEGGGSEKAFTGICGQMVCEKISMVSISLLQFLQIK